MYSYREYNILDVHVGKTWKYTYVSREVRKVGTWWWDEAAAAAVIAGSCVESEFARRHK